MSEALKKPTSAAIKRRRKDGRQFNPGSPKRLAYKLKELEVLDRRLEGMSFDEIGAAMGIPGNTAHSIIMRLLDRYDNELGQKVGQARREEIERNRKMLQYLQVNVRKGDPKAIRVAVQISERISRLQGLDAPVELKHEGTGPGGAITVEIFRQMISDEDPAPITKEVGNGNGSGNGNH